MGNNHQCPKEGCEESVDDKKDVCYDHRCIMSNCKKVTVTDNFCQRHSRKEKYLSDDIIKIGRLSSGLFLSYTIKFSPSNRDSINDMISKLRKIFKIPSDIDVKYIGYIKFEDCFFIGNPSNGNSFNLIILGVIGRAFDEKMKIIDQRGHIIDISEKCIKKFNLKFNEFMEGEYSETDS